MSIEIVCEVVIVEHSVDPAVQAVNSAEAGPALENACAPDASGTLDAGGQSQPLTKCSEIMQAIVSDPCINARLWRRPGRCSVQTEKKCTGDQQACPFRR
ncbi:MAG: hypothetical protein WCC39_09925 [Telluria sp.]